MKLLLLPLLFALTYLPLPTHLLTPQLIHMAQAILPTCHLNDQHYFQLNHTRYLAKCEMHSPTQHIPKPHMGVSIYYLPPQDSDRLDKLDEALKNLVP